MSSGARQRGLPSPASHPWTGFRPLLAPSTELAIQPPLASLLIGSVRKPSSDRLRSNRSTTHAQDTPPPPARLRIFAHRSTIVTVPILPRRAMHHGCVAGANGGEEAAAGWWRTWRSWRWGGRTTTPASSLPTTSSTCPATASHQGAGTAPAQPRSAWKAKHRWRGSAACSRAATPTPASCSAAPTARARCPRSTWCCAPRRASRSSTGSATRPPAGRCWPPTMPASARRPPTSTSTSAPAAATPATSTCPDRGC